MKTTQTRSTRISMFSVRCWMLNVALALFLFSSGSAMAEVHYVDLNSTNAMSPYTNWSTAATIIQDAVDAAVAGDEIVVTNGIYARGGRNGSRVMVDKPLSLRSVNGPQFTSIRGDTGLQRFRCVYFVGGGSLSGFTLNHGIVQGPGGAGGGAYGGTLKNCILTGNSALSSGGGAFLCTLENCTLTGNSAADGGGAFECTLNNCTLTDNSAAGTGGPGSRGGARYCVENNCILFGNTNPSGCEDCGSPGQLSGDNCYGNPLFVDQASGNLQLQSNSPCINAGNNSYVTSATDLDGNPRIVGGRVDIGAYEFQAVRYVDVNSTNATAPYSSWTTAATNIQDAVDAAVAGDEIVVTNGVYNTGGRDGNRVKVDKPLTLRSVNGPQLTTVDGGYDGRCAYLTNGAALSGFTLTNGVADVGGGVFCESRTAVVFNCLLLGNVAKGAAGGGAYGGTLNNCTLTGNSAEAPLGYDIGGRFPRGFYAGDASGGGAAVCTLNDCTLTGNSARAPFNYAAFYGGAYGGRASGGGAAWCVLSNCTVAGNVAQTPFNSVILGNDRWPLPWNPGAYGGGAYNCTMTNCILTDNSARGYAGTFNGRPVNIYGYGGGALDSMLNNCAVSGNSASTYGGGAYNCTLTNCTLTGNYYDGALSSTLINCALIGNSGAGASDSTLTNCTLTGNYYGALSSTLINCALTGNSVAGAGYSMLNNCTLTGNGGGAGYSTLNNCIVYFNGGNWYSAENTLNHCCTMPLPTNGIGNITNAPLFVDTNGWANFRLQSNSPCINAGLNAFAPAGPDLDGNPRIAGGTVDIGAYEFQAPASKISYAWLQQFNLPVDSMTDSADPDGDGVSNYREWLAGSDPTNPFSFAPLLTLIRYGADVVLTWPTNAVGFTLQSTTNLVYPVVWSTNSPAAVVIGGQNVIIDNMSGAQQFYRLIQ